MNIGRRAFLKQSVSGAAVIALLPGLAFLEGCPVSQSELEDLVNELGVAVTALLPYLKGVSTALASQITAGVAAIAAAIKSWVPGTAITNIEQIINEFVANMNLIPVIGQYEPLVALIVATAEGILAILLPSGSVGNVMVGARGVSFVNPPHSHRQFRNAWNKIAKANPSLSPLVLAK